MFTRRQLVLSAAASASTSFAMKNAFASFDETLQQTDVMYWPTVSDILERQQTEVSPWSDYPRRLATVSKIVSYVPTDTHPFRSALYFLSLARNETPDISDDQLAAFNDEYDNSWPYYMQEEIPKDINNPEAGTYPYENPLIVLFFNETQLRDYKATDETSWCAAFVNFCIVKAYAGRADSSTLPTPPLHGLAERFNSFASQTSTPKCGDIVVFRRRYTNNAGKIKYGGHVGFYIMESENKKSVYVLGGNQGNRVKISLYPKDGFMGKTHYKVRSYRSLPSLSDELPVCPEISS